MDDLESSIAFLIAEIGSNIEKIENDLEDLRNEMNASRSSMPADRKDIHVTGMRGVEKLKVYTGEVSRWKGWRIKVATWLTQTNPSFESLMSKLDQSELDPQEPEGGQKIMAGLQ